MNVEFPSLSGKTSIRTIETSSLHSSTRRDSFHPFQGRPLFGRYEMQYLPANIEAGFHPFQGRPSFGPVPAELAGDAVTYLFPSLSGKTFIRTSYSCDLGKTVTPWFPSLSGKTFIRTRSRRAGGGRSNVPVSIPFREDLHSDKLELRKSTSSTGRCFHPFQGRPSFGQL